MKTYGENAKDIDQFLEKFRIYVGFVNKYIKQNIYIYNLHYIIWLSFEEIVCVKKNNIWLKVIIIQFCTSQFFICTQTMKTM